MREVLAAAVVWLAQNTMYELPDTRPEIVVKPHTAVRDLQGVDHDDFFALYDPERNRIVLSERIDLGTVPGRAKLVHELVHWLQYEAGFKTYRCYGEREFEAYAAQESYERAHAAASSVNWVWVIGHYQCPPAFAPDHTHPDYAPR